MNFLGLICFLFGFIFFIVLFLEIDLFGGDEEFFLKLCGGFVVLVNFFICLNFLRFVNGLLFL